MRSSIDRNRRGRLILGWKGLLSLKVSVIVCILVSWNGLLVYARHLAAKADLTSLPAAAPLIAALLCLSVFSAATVLSPPFRAAVVAYNRRRLYRACPFVFISLLTLTMTLIVAFGYDHGL